MYLSSRWWLTKGIVIGISIWSMKLRRSSTLLTKMDHNNSAASFKKTLIKLKNGRITKISNHK